MSTLEQEMEEPWAIGDEFEVNDPREEGNLFRVKGFHEMPPSANVFLAKLGMDVPDTRAVDAVLLERHAKGLVGTASRSFPVSLMVRPGQRRSNRSAGVAAVKRVVKNARECECGCGETTKGGRFRPGHDARMHARNKKG